MNEEEECGWEIIAEAPCSVQEVYPNDEVSMELIVQDDDQVRPEFSIIHRGFDVRKGDSGMIVTRTCNCCGHPSVVFKLK